MCNAKKLTGKAGVTPTLAIAVDVYRVVCGTNLLMFCVCVDPSVCEYTPDASATKATRATAVLLTILACICTQSHD